ncbi:MAG: hypothetical protein K2G73_01325 [Eubacterium sp.]|nr:hypothetical protein [Eubacterium sp.]
MKRTVKIIIAVVLIAAVISAAVIIAVQKRADVMVADTTESTYNYNSRLAFENNIVRIDMAKDIGHDKDIVSVKDSETIKNIVSELSGLYPSEISYEAVYEEALYVITLYYEDGESEKLSVLDNNEFLVRNNVMYDINGIDMDALWKSLL